MVRPLRRNRGLYTAKLRKATDTSAGFCTWVEVAQLTPTNRLGAIPTTPGTHPEPADAAASQGLDDGLRLSVGGS
jgi:hypothetical protein